MAKKVLMATIVLLALSMMLISQGGAFINPVYLRPTPRKIPAIVSTEWLNASLTLTDLVVLDVRSPGAYSLGHIPEAINVPEAEWYVNDPGTVPLEIPWMELPPDEDIFDLIGDAGITKNSLVVVVGATSGPVYPVPEALYGVAGTTRVAITLLYAGVKNVAILDGGYDKWVADGYETETETAPNTLKPVTYTGKVDKTMFVSKDYVKKRRRKIVDARDPDVYFGVTQEPWTAYPGHIPTAKCFPTPWLWNINTADGLTANYITYKDADTLKEMALGVVGKNKNRKVIVYCGVGGYASTMYFVLSEVLGYNNVKLYDGSAQEWTQTGEPVVLYTWE